MYFYIPKIESYIEAEFWKDFFDYDKQYGLQICNSQQYVGSPDDPNIKPSTGLY